VTPGSRLQAAPTRAEPSARIARQVAPTAQSSCVSFVACCLELGPITGIVFVMPLAAPPLLGAALPRHRSTVAPVAPATVVKRSARHDRDARRDSLDRWSESRRIARENTSTRGFRTGLRRNRGSHSVDRRGAGRTLPIEFVASGEEAARRSPPRATACISVSVRGC